MALTLAEIKRLVGQHFFVGFSGKSVPPEYASLVQEFHLGGTIYFKHNVESPAQLAELSNELQFSVRPKEDPGFFIAIDHEGGKVNRLVKPFTKFPGIDHLGELNSPRLAFHFGLVLAKELKAVGININFAPVVDVLTNKDNAAIRNRAFSSDVEICSKMGSAVCRGIQKVGIASVAKHFPGHGDVKEDSHFKLPQIHRSIEELEQRELIPFSRIIKSRVEGVMTAHILNTAIDKEFPATLSYKTITEILRKKLRFRNIIFSDDMEMKAVAEGFDPGQAAVLALKAGVDIVEYRGDAGIHPAAIEAVIKAVESKEIPESLLRESEQRILSCKKRYVNSQRPIDVTEVGQQIGQPAHFKIAEIITKKELPEGDISQSLPEIV